MDIVKSKAGFRLLRETVGLTQSALARMVGVNVQTVKYWENPNNPQYKPNEQAWELLYQLVEGRHDTVTNYVAHAPARQENPIRFTYYRSQADYDRLVGDGGFFGVANATTCACVEALLSADIGVEVRFAGSDTP